MATPANPTAQAINERLIADWPNHGRTPGMAFASNIRCQANFFGITVDEACEILEAQELIDEENDNTEAQERFFGC